MRPIQSEEDEIWDRVAYYAEWLERTGLTPDQVDSLPAWFLERAPDYWAIRAEVTRELRRQQG